MTRFSFFSSEKTVESVAEQNISNERQGEDLTVGFGRFNPPTVGHQLLLNKIQETAGGGEYRVYPTQTQDSKKNPLDFDTKVSFMRKMYPEHASNIVSDKGMKTIFDVL